jgi:asparaginyl-tRNA synthetase
VTQVESAARTYEFRPPGSWASPRDHFLVALSHPWYRALVAIQDTIVQATAAFWAERDIRHLLLPITTGSISSPMGLGSDSEPVSVEIGGERTYLADSMQFLLEYGCRVSPPGCYYVMPSFRGEATDRTHMSEFFHSEAEITGTLEDVIGTVEEYLRALAAALLARNPGDVQAAVGTTGHLERLVATPSLPRLTFDEAAAVLGRRGGELRTDPAHGFRTVPRASEQLLMEYCGGIVWLTHWDQLAVPFYQALSADGRTTLNGDLLIGQGEAIGAGERHRTGAEVLDALRRHEVSPGDYEWYVAMKENHPLTTSGFGLGIERFLLWVLDHNDVRDLQLLPRMRGHGLVP